MLDQLHRMREELEKELIKDAFQRGLLWGIVIALAFVIILLFLSHLGIFDSFIMETMVKNQ